MNNETDDVEKTIDQPLQLSALLVARKREWLEEAQKLIDGMTADEFEIFISKCSVIEKIHKCYECGDVNNLLEINGETLCHECADCAGLI